jgi:hypothetical protein
MRRLSGWARLWIVIAAVVWIGFTIYSLQIAAEHASDQLRYVGTPMTGEQFWIMVATGSMAGLLLGAVMFGLAMIARAVTLWVWRGFRPQSES